MDDQRYRKNEKALRFLRNEEALRFLVGQKISSLNTAGNVCMTWWVSSVVFCGTILAAIWLQRKELAESRFIIWLLFAVLTLFFAGIVSFGIVVISHLKKFREDVLTLTTGLQQGGLFRTDLEFFKWGMIIGTSSFALILLAWIIFWVFLYCYMLTTSRCGYVKSVLPF